jgi:hypothetical protein
MAAGELLPVEYTPPEDDDIEMAVDSPSTGKARAEEGTVTGKRKAVPE